MNPKSHPLISQTLNRPSLTSANQFQHISHETYPLAQCQSLMGAVAALYKQNNCSLYYCMLCLNDPFLSSVLIKHNFLFPLLY